ncbi:hypothetical protein [Methylobacterium haplocladii]|uniref:Uncharacterized protein n=1 Tax=Methylobacterium haplocladii TaxID=1176176 RepID=A0A512IUY1_9HYPH|nr:hypothetical protein [Methylobacterium haplocladii]GEP01510.1 hypothetical protein MHA02_38970 [Methylobacterium haplocladii]GJD82305.1 hypothetical protein HPGCJGGD_0157 [Methylobacterium haplocladii]GLS59161.1 hypothetical protein GCM10007887_18270 [Methylobacterium haplocladii]
MHSDLPNEFDAASIGTRRMMAGLEAVGTLEKHKLVLIDGRFWKVRSKGLSIILRALDFTRTQVLWCVDLAELWLSKRAHFGSCRSVEALLDEAGSWAWRRLPCALRGKLSSDGRMLTFERALDRYEGSDHIVGNASRLSDPVRWGISRKVTSCAYKYRATSPADRLRKSIRHVLRLADCEAREFFQYREHLRTYGDRPFVADLLDSFARRGWRPLAYPWKTHRFTHENSFA